MQGAPSLSSFPLPCGQTLQDQGGPQTSTAAALWSFFKKLFILFWAALGLCCFGPAFSSCSEQGLPFVVVRWLLVVVASLIAEHWFSCSTAYGIFPNQGSNLCPLHWQADSDPLSHQESPCDSFIYRSFTCDFLWIKRPMANYTLKLSR